MPLTPLNGKAPLCGAIVLAIRPEGLIGANILNVLLQSYEIHIHMIGSRYAFYEVLTR
jgi:hypothetical protein